MTAIMDSDKHYVIGTAGHIDHGKTALVQKLTGVDTDRLKEEKERGITIDLGFAHFSENVTIIDVPGHEKLIKNMVAGVNTIDLVLFVIAADDSIMPQTREHLDIVNLLGIQNGIFVITKIDLVDQDWIRLVEEEVKELLRNTIFAEAQIIKTSVVTGEGIEELKLAIQSNLSRIENRQDNDIFRLPIDRSFLKPGFGNIVTGSVISGELKIGETVEILPEKITARIRGLQSHNRNVEEVKKGFRAALNLVGIEHEQLYRGQVVTQPGLYEPVQLLNAKLTVLKNSPIRIKNQMRVRIHLHTLEFLARIILPIKRELLPGEDSYAQIKLEKSVYASYKDKFIIRQYSPQITIGGGEVIETNPPKYRKRYHDEFLRRIEGLSSDLPKERVLAVFSSRDFDVYTLDLLRIKTGLNRSDLKILIDELEHDKLIYRSIHGKDEIFFSHEQIAKVLAKISTILTAYHERFPGRYGMPITELQSQVLKQRNDQLFQIAINTGVSRNLLRSLRNSIALASFQKKLTEVQKQKIELIENRYKTAGFNPPLINELISEFKIEMDTLRELLRLLRWSKKLIPIDEKIFFHTDTVQKAIEMIRVYFRTNNELKVTQFKELVNTTRKYAIPLLTYLDSEGYTNRQGEIRIAGPKLNK